MKYIILALALLSATVGFSAEPAPTPAPPTVTTVTTTEVIASKVESIATNVATNVTNDIVDKTTAAVSEGVSSAVAATKEGVSSAVASTKEAINNVAPPEARGQFLSLVTEKLRKYSDYGEQAVASAVEEVKEQFPLVVKEYLNWNLAENLFYIIITDFALIALLITFYKTFPKWLHSLTEETTRHKTTEVDVKQFKYGASGIISGVASAVVICIILSHLEWYLNSLKIIIAPRVYLLEQVSQFVQQVANK